MGFSGFSGQLQVPGSASPQLSRDMTYDDTL